MLKIKKFPNNLKNAAGKMTCIDRAAKTVIRIVSFFEKRCTKLRDKNGRVSERYQALISSLLGL